MGAIIDLQSRRLGIEIEPIQAGVTAITDYLGHDRIILNATHPGYHLDISAEAEQNGVGIAGLNDFISGFEGIFGDSTDRRAASFAYGAYSMGRIALPECVMATPELASAFECSVERYVEKSPPGTDFAIAAETVAAHAAATLSIMGLWGIFKSQPEESRRIFSSRVQQGSFPPGNRNVASSFRFRLNETVLLKLIGKPIPKHTR